MVLDASALITRLWGKDIGIAEADVIAPDLIVAESTNVVWKLERAHKPAPDVSLLLAILDMMRIVPSRPYAERAHQIAKALDHSVYDALYIAVAEAENATLLTADQRLSRKIAKTQFQHLVRTVP